MEKTKDIKKKIKKRKKVKRAFMTAALLVAGAMGGVLGHYAVGKLTKKRPVASRKDDSVKRLKEAINRGESIELEGEEKVRVKIKFKPSRVYFEASISRLSVSISVAELMKSPKKIKEAIYSLSALIKNGVAVRISFTFPTIISRIPKYKCEREDDELLKTLESLFRKEQKVVSDIIQKIKERVGQNAEATISNTCCGYVVTFTPTVCRPAPKIKPRKRGGDTI